VRILSRVGTKIIREKKEESSGKGGVKMFGRPD